MRVDALVSHFANPVSRPLHGLQIEVADATSQKDHALDFSLLQPLQTLLALMFHRRNGHRLFIAVIPHVAAENFATRRPKLFGPAEILGELIELRGVPCPERHDVALSHVVADRIVELLGIHHYPEV